MPDLIWRHKIPGQDTFNVTPEFGANPDCKVTMIAPVPDVVRLPPALGGQVVKVTGSGLRPCPCSCGDTVRHLDLEGNLGVAECAHRGFLWYRKRS